MADVTLTIDADTAGYIAKIAQLAKTNDTVKTSTKGMASEIATGMTAANLAVSALITAFDLVAAKVANARDKVSELNRMYGQQALHTGVDLLTAGMTTGQANYQLALMRRGGVKGVVNSEGIANFASAVADENRRRQDAHQPLIGSEEAGALFANYEARGDTAYDKGGRLLLQTVNAGSSYFRGFNQKPSDINQRGAEIANAHVGSRGIPSGITAELATQFTVANLDSDTETKRDGRLSRIADAAYSNWSVDNTGAAAGVELLHQDTTLKIMAENSFYDDLMLGGGGHVVAAPSAHGPAALLINALTKTMSQALNRQTLRHGNGHNE